MMMVSNGLSQTTVITFSGLSLVMGHILHTYIQYIYILYIIYISYIKCDLINLIATGSLVPLQMPSSLTHS